MPKKKIENPEGDYFNGRKFSTPVTEEARENQMIELAMDLVEHRLRTGTATSQETTHFLKLGSVRARLDMKAAEKQIAVMDAKIKSLQDAGAKDSEYEKVIAAMKEYRGELTEEDFDD